MRIGFDSGKAVGRALDAWAGVFEDVGVDHGRSNVGVAKEFANRADVGSRLEQMGCEGMP